MKKSKVLIPAMALLLFSTAASITGTVAWFTSTRTFTSNVGDFEVARLDGNLECTGVSDPIGVSATTTDTGVNVSPIAGALLTDASYNHLTGTLYTDDADVENKYVPLTYGTAEAGTTWLAREVSSKKFFYGFTWTYTFSYTFAAETAMNLYFDVRNSTATCWTNAASSMQVTDTTQWDTIKGWRMAFVVSGDGNNKTVWAPFRDQVNDNGTPDNTTDDFNDIRYVGTTTTIADYLQESRKDLMDMSYKTDNDSVIPPSGTHGTAHNNYLGQITKPAQADTGTLAVKVVTWYEGTDALITTRNAMSFQRARATLKFTVREAE